MATLVPDASSFSKPRTQSAKARARGRDAAIRNGKRDTIYLVRLAYLRLPNNAEFRRLLTLQQRDYDTNACRMPSLYLVLQPIAAARPRHDGEPARPRAGDPVGGGFHNARPSADGGRKDYCP